MGRLPPRPGSRRRNRLHLLVQPEPHADQPVQRGGGVDEGVERLIALAVALRLPGADRPAALEPGGHLEKPVVLRADG